ncbi:hypothetical protein BJY16_005437 [Actinoplanes octamycinicus]|uniref:Uncharacterized protein n=1 Tax=Actinoplanes octamycinicus TaxID=135948 RepID=A0A7W7M9G3_9ACTN|nr:hypothetical protein [Actinoplanes octamycinicus]
MPSSTKAARRQVTVAFTPDFRGDPDNAEKALIDQIICA